MPHNLFEKNWFVIYQFKYTFEGQTIHKRQFFIQV